VRPLIEGLAGKQIAIIDTGAAVATQLKKKLSEEKLLVLDGNASEIIVWTNSEAKNAEQVIQALLNEPVEIKKLTLA
jgi:glutamate racemase